MLVALFFLFAFIWSVKSGQYDDRYTPSIRMLFDDEDENKNYKNENQKNVKNEI